MRIIPVVRVSSEIMERLEKARAGLVQKKVWIKDGTGRKGHYRMAWVKPDNDRAGDGRGQLDLFAEPEKPAKKQGVEHWRESLKETEANIAAIERKIEENKKIGGRDPSLDKRLSEEKADAESLRRMIAEAEPKKPAPTATEPSLEEMAKEAARWKGAAMKVAQEIGDDKSAALKHSHMTIKADLDAYLMRKFGIDAARAREVSNHLTHMNIQADMRANVEDFKNEPWYANRPKREEANPSAETKVKIPFAIANDAEALASSGLDDSYFDIKPAFGSAGGPGKLYLSESGLEKAFEIASGSLGWKIKAKYIKALQDIYARGKEGIARKGLDGKIDALLGDISRVEIEDRNQESLAASMQGDEAKYEKIRDENRLVYLEDGPGITPRWRITTSGKKFIESAALIEKVMIATKSKKPGATPAAPATKSEGKIKKLSDFMPIKDGGTFEHEGKTYTIKVKAIHGTDYINVMRDDGTIEGSVTFGRGKMGGSYFPTPTLQKVKAEVFRGDKPAEVKKSIIESFRDGLAKALGAR